MRQISSLQLEYDEFKDRKGFIAKKILAQTDSAKELSSALS